MLGSRLIVTCAGFAEKSPVVVISGAPGMKEREKNPLLHHKVREFDTQKKVFDQLTVASTVLGNPQTAFQEVDRVLHAALRYKRPVYIELPRDTVFVPGIPHHTPREIHELSNPKTLAAALAEAVAMINAARKPVILADVEVHRFGLQEELVRLVQKTNIPVAATIMGKSVFPESDPAYIGHWLLWHGRRTIGRIHGQSPFAANRARATVDGNLELLRVRGSMPSRFGNALHPRRIGTTRAANAGWLRPVQRRHPRSSLF
jgi:TPP-dependent 2-oxoacid decarboxylase